MSEEADDSNEHFFTSFTDLLVGVIFLFILLLMVFALNLKHPKVITSEEVRTEILNEVALRMQAQNMPVTLDLANGVVRLPESLLFASGQWELLPEGQVAVAALAQILRDVLPCASKQILPCNWQAQPITLDSVLIEGHTDKEAFNGPQGMGNWELSAFRAIAVYKAMTGAAEGLESDVLNMRNQPLLGVSAYADRRPVDKTQLDPNRRIDVRFNMRVKPGQQVVQ